MPDKRKVYFDSCCFIDMVKHAVGQTMEEGQAKEVWYLKQLAQAARDGELEVLTSVLTIAECTHAGGDISPQVQSNFTSLLMSGQYVRLIQPTPFIATDARDLRWKHGINVGGADGLHIASALALRCEEFVTSDKRPKMTQQKAALARLNLRMVDATETKCLPAKYLQGDLWDGQDGKLH